MRLGALATDSSGTTYYFDNSQTPDLSPSAHQQWQSNPLGILSGSNSANAWVVEPAPARRGWSRSASNPN